MSEKNSSTIKLDKNSELRRIRRTKLFFVGLLFALVLLGGVIGFLRKKDLQISTISVIGTRSLDSAVVQKTAREYLDGYFMVLIPKTNTLLLSKNSLSQYILDTIPTIKKADVVFIDKNHIEISVIEKDPSYVWCATTCYFVDNTGMIYEESPEFTNGVFIRFSGGMTMDNPIKNHFVSDQRFTEIVKMLQVFKQLDITITGMDFSDDVSIFLQNIKHVSVGNSARLIIRKDTTAQNIIDTLTLLLNDTTFSNSIITKGQTLQYIDIRFPDKIYYKFDTPVTQLNEEPPKKSNAKLLEKTQ